ncbi:hypothetical protein [Tsukamurella sp. PLM1]|uniref:hypothetical protein n=1 Tax=Tsukamurella sp. PLM1 TaxID=2929795 RepID=UPI002052CDD4|nr:hypothetical protein [Tsukamurella sp. PLM1]BDH57848.1 hypothetical protein MTP03_27870 [Tsukamurella sp. PLM1]
MTSQELQERPESSPVPSVPEGTPGRDPRAELPAPLPPGAQQPWRRHGPGNRTWVVVVTAVAAVLMAVVGIVAVTFGFATTAFVKHGAVVLMPAQYTATTTTCSGTGGAADVREGARITFRGQGGTFDATLDKGVLRSGRCVLGFEVSTLDANPNQNYAVSVAGIEGTPVAGDELASSSGTVVVNLIAR